jgi:hypothetical protein
VLKSFRHSSSKWKGTSLAKRLVRGLVILEKLPMKRRYNPAWPKKFQIPFTLVGGDSCSITSTFALSTSTSLGTKCPRMMPSQTMKLNFSKFSTRSFSWHLFTTSRRWRVAENDLSLWPCWAFCSRCTSSISWWFVAGLAHSCYFLRPSYLFYWALPALDSPTCYTGWDKWSQCVGAIGPSSQPLALHCSTFFGDP